MRKAFNTALAFLALLGCTRIESIVDTNENNTVEPFTITAYADEIDTKATLDNSLNMLWATGDRICVSMYESGAYTPWEREFELSSGAGKTYGTFTIVGDGTPGENTRFNAIYPKYDNTFKNPSSDAVDPAIARIKLLDTYTWSDKTILAPMVAYGTDADKQGLHFKHVGGAVKVPMKSLPIGTTKVSLTCDKDITGDFAYTVANIADETPAALTVPASNGGKTVSFTFDALTSAEDRVFYFPTPTLTAPSFTIKVYVGSAVIWQGHTSTAQPNLTRGGLLELPELTVSPHYLYVLDGGVITGMTYKEWPSTRQIYAGGQNFDKIGIKQEGSYTYNKFIVPVGILGSENSIYYKDGASGNYQVEIKATLSTSTKDHYFRTDGCTFVEVTTPSSPENVPKGIWARSTDNPEANGIWLYAWGGVSADWPQMTSTTSKYDGKAWHTYSYGSSSGNYNVLFTYNNRKTADITNLSTGNSYYFDVWDNGSSIGYYQAN